MTVIERDMAAIHSTGILVRGFLEQLQKSNKHAGWWGPKLQGGCAVGAYVSNKLLKRTNLRSQLVMGMYEEDFGHCWVEVALTATNVQVLDVTATQFGSYPNVLLTPVQEYLGLRFARGFTDFWYGRQAISKLSEWSAQERPERYRHHIDKFLNVITPAQASVAA
jgi:hypothetical protein